MRQKRKVPRDAHPTRAGKQPFYGRHQAGILTPQQASMMLVAFDVLAAIKPTSSGCFAC
jgi:deferrochelatase/peroxidase EfeB